MRLTTLIRFACALFIAVESTPALAITLGEAVNLALQNDPTFLAAQANLNVSRERSAQALANLLPQLNATANTTNNRRDYTIEAAVRTNVLEKYNSNAVQLNLTQPLWQRAKYISLTQADIIVSQADYQLAAAGQDLLVRLAQAWFDAMQARDELAFNHANVLAMQRLWEQTRRANELGVAPITDLEDARVKYDQAMADHAMTESEQGIKLAALEQIVGPLVLPILPVLPEQFTTPDLHNDTLEQWLKQAETSSPSIRAAQRALDAADEEVRKQRAGHEPTVDLVASYGKFAQGAGLSGGQNGFESQINTVGVQLNAPLYAGGGQSAKVREAGAMKEKAKHELESALRNVRSTIKQAWYTWQAGRIRQQSALQGLKRANFAIKAAESERDRGVKVELDVLQARQQSVGALRDLQKARYDMVASYLKLKAATGQLMGNDLAEMDKGFEARVEGKMAQGLLDTNGQ